MNIIDDGKWEYLNQGGANLVLSYIGDEKSLISKVLRLRKHDNGVSSRQVYEYIKSSKFDKLRKWIVSMDFVQVSKSLISRFGGLNEHHGILMPNLLGHKPVKIKVNKYIKLWESDNGYVLELKPKWLNRNDNLNCRNCLISRKKNQEFILCPLWLLHDIHGIEFWCRQVQSRLDVDLMGSIKDAIIKNIELIETLSNLQDDNIQQLILYGDEEEELQFQMTIRDVSIFFNLQTGNANIIDLDLKPLSKRDTWINDENNLKQSYNESTVGLQCPR